MAAFAIVANAQWWQNSGRYSHQRKGAAQVAGSGTYGNSGSSNSGINPYAGSVNGSVPISGSGTGTGTTSNELSKSAPVSSSSDNGAGSTASFTQYGGCNTASAACGWYSSSGYNAAISQAVYGGGTGSGATAACGVCWKLTPDFPGANEIVVKVNNLCPDEGNPLCAQPEGEISFAIFGLDVGFGAKVC